MHRITLAAAIGLLALALGGCAASPESPAAPGTALSGDLTISAAASLQLAFDAAVDEFTAAHPDVSITVAYDGSSTLATQIIGGAHVDVFASADEANMTAVTDARLARDPQIFARNTLVVVVPRGNPAGITRLEDLADPGAKVVLCAPAVPCGAASEALLRAHGVTLAPASQEQNVTAVLTKVQADEADAGLVYKTDAATAADVESFVPDGAAEVVNSYPIVTLTDAPNARAADAFVSFIVGAEGQRILAEFGFDSP